MAISFGSRRDVADAVPSGRDKRSPRAGRGSKVHVRLPCEDGARQTYVTDGQSSRTEGWDGFSSDRQGGWRHAPCRTVASSAWTLRAMAFGRWKIDHAERVGDDRTQGSKVLRRCQDLAS